MVKKIRSQDGKEKKTKRLAMSKILEIGGVKLSTAASNSRYKRRDDSLIIVIDEGAAISGKFTKNKFKASPIKICLLYTSPSPRDRG